MQVQVPDGLVEGQMFMMATPDGGAVQIQVPPGVKAGQMIMVNQLAAAMPIPQMPQGAQPVGASQDFLMTMDGLFVRQQLELLEMVSGCETKNRCPSLTSTALCGQGAPGLQAVDPVAPTTSRAGTM